MKKEIKKRGIPTFIGIASVWFGTHVGPGIASGAQVANYYGQFGKIGLITPIISMIFLGLCVYFALDYCRIHSLRDFKSFTNKFFYPYEKIFGVFFEMCFLVTTLLAPGLCIATSARLLDQFFGIDIWIGSCIIVFLSIILVIYGASLVKAASTGLTLGIILIILCIVYVGIKIGGETFSYNWNSTQINSGSWGVALWMAISYAGFQSTGISGNCISVSEGLTTRKECIKTAILGVVMNAGMLMAVVAVGYAFSPEAISNELPNFYIVQQFNKPIFESIYVLFVILASLSTIITFAFALVARFGSRKFIKNKIENDTIRSLVIVLFMLGLDVMVSTFGITKIISVGYTWLGYGSIFAVLIPFIFVGFKKTLGNVRENM